MTCIVGLVQNGVVHIGGDSLGVGGYCKSVRADKKVFHRGPFVIGFTSSFRMGQILQHKLEVPEHKEGVDDYAYMVTEFVDAVRKCLKDAGFAKKLNEEETGGTFLVGYRGRLYEIEDDYQVAMFEDEYSAVGCGHDIAKGAMYAQPSFTHPVERIRVALEAASRFSAGVGGPLHFVSSADNK